MSEPTQTESLPANQKPKKAGKKRGRHITWVTALLGLLTAILVLVSGYLGYLAQQNNLAASQANERAAEAKSTAASQSSAIDTLTSDQAINSNALQSAQSSISVLSSDNSVLSAQNQSLSSVVANQSTVSSSTAPGPSTPTISASTPTVRNPNPISLRAGSPHIDLDSTESNWATDPANEAGADLSFYSPEDRLAMGYGTRMSLLKTTPANYDNCKASYASMSSGEEKIGLFAVNDNVCVLTGESRYVALVVTSVTGGIQFNATSYDPPGR